MKHTQALVELEELIDSIPEPDIKDNIKSDFELIVSKNKNLRAIIIKVAESLHQHMGNDFDQLWEKKLYNSWMELMEEITQNKIS